MSSFELLEIALSSVGTVDAITFDLLFCSKFCGTIDSQVLNLTGPPLQRVKIDSKIQTPTITELTEGKILFVTSGSADLIIIVSVIMYNGQIYYAMFLTGPRKPLERVLLAESFLLLLQEINKNYGVDLAFKLAKHVANAVC